MTASTSPFGPPEDGMFFPSANGGDGWLLDETAPGVGHVRWNNTHGPAVPETMHCERDCWIRSSDSCNESSTR
jgi:hypothetical protein